MLSLEGGASITETDNAGETALLLAACAHNGFTKVEFYPPMVQWLLEFGGAQITDTDNAGISVWTVDWQDGLPHMLIGAYAINRVGKFMSLDGEYIEMGDIVALTAMLRVMLLHGGPSEFLAKDLAPPFQQIVQDGARLRARLPAYLTQRRALLDAHCPLLPPLQALVHGYEEPTTTDEFWATGLGAPKQRDKRARPESSKRRSARLRQKRL
jgi:hypothetical protein